MTKTTYIINREPSGIYVIKELAALPRCTGKNHYLTLVEYDEEAECYVDSATQTGEKTMTTQRELSEFVGREVIYCVSALISELAKDEAHHDMLADVLGGYRECRECGGTGWTGDDDDGREACGECDEGEELVEIFEHWIVSNHLADALEQQGEAVARDILGLVVWGRATTGQAIALDPVIEKIQRAMKVA